MFQCHRYVQICLFLALPSFWSCNGTKLPKPWKMLLILSTLHSTWAKRATFLWQTYIVSCSKRNIFIGPVDTVVWGNCLVWIQMVVSSCFPLDQILGFTFFTFFCIWKTRKKTFIPSPEIRLDINCKNKMITLTKASYSWDTLHSNHWRCVGSTTRRYSITVYQTSCPS